MVIFPVKNGGSFHRFLYVYLWAIAKENHQGSIHCGSNRREIMDHPTDYNLRMKN
jgi:hypothetical protein